MDEDSKRASDALQLYAAELKAQHATGHAAEHAYRPALKSLMEQLGQIAAVNDPKRSEHGAPDFVFLQHGTETAIQGWAETKDLTADLNKVEKSEQLQRYAGYPNLFLTNYVEFRFYSNGARYDEIEIADLRDGTLELHPERYEMLADALRDFLAKPPEPITNGKRLAEVMGAKARRIKHNVERFLSVNSDRNEELLRIFTLIKTLLVHDMDEAKFADMYARRSSTGCSPPDTTTRPRTHSHARRRATSFRQATRSCGSSSITSRARGSTRGSDSSSTSFVRSSGSATFARSCTATLMQRKAAAQTTGIRSSTSMRIS